MASIVFDLETIPTHDTRVINAIYDSIKPPANYSKPESISKWMEENKEAEFDKVYRKTALDGLYGEIISIAWKIDNDETQVVYRPQYEDEYLLISAFLNKIANLIDKHDQRANISKWIGHNIINFDIRFLWQRCIVLGIKPSVKIPIDIRPWDDGIFDTMISWAGNSSQYQGAKKLDKICTQLGLGCKGDLDGSKIWDAWLDKRFEDIAKYNIEDVEMTYKLYQKLTFQDLR
jgi:predicted PolB exonuclease-like 3'-5' exonuclease